LIHLYMSVFQVELEKDWNVIVDFCLRSRYFPVMLFYEKHEEHR
jgi:hypothetical protein